MAASGTGFGPSCGARLAIEDPDGAPLAALGDTPVGRDGSFATQIVVPALPDGPYVVTARGLTTGRTAPCDTLLPDGPVAGKQFAITPAPPPPPKIGLNVSNSSVPPGAVVVLTASNPGPSIAFYEFDLNGNGSYETKCGGPNAAVVSGGTATVKVGVQAVATNGAKTNAQSQVSFAGTPSPPPKPGGGNFSAFAADTIAGGCSTADIALATLNIYKCPATVNVGVVEASVPPGSGEQCFERKDPAGAFSRFVNTGKKALVNGLQFETISSHLVIGEKIKQMLTDAKPGKKDAKFKAVKPGYSTTVASAPFHLYWDISKPGKVGTVPFASPFGLGTFLGLPYALKSSPVTLTAAGKAEFKLYLELPLPKFLFKSIATAKPLTVKTDASDGVDIAGGGYTIAVNDVNVGIFRLEKIAVSYKREGNSDVWSGGFDLVFPSSGVSADGSVVVRDGVLQKLAAAINPGPPGIGPIGCCVWIVGFDGTLTNAYIDVGATFAAGPQVVGNARAADAHGHATIFYEPFEFLITVDNVHVVTVPVKAKGQVSVSGDGFAFKGNIDQGFGPFSVDADVGANIGPSGWFAGGGGDGCISVIISACVGVSAGVGPNGVSACGGITIVPGTWFNDPVKLSGGAVVYWPIGSGFGVFKGCGMGKIKGKVGAPAIAELGARRGGGGPVGFKVGGGMPVGLFTVEGEGGHPVVRLRGPEGVDITSPAGAGQKESGRGYFATTITNDNTTYIAVGHPPKGRYTVTPLAGSPPIRSVGLGEGLPNRVARGKVVGKGRKRTLRYRVAKVPGAKVIFVERGGDPSPQKPGESVDRVLGKTKGGKGTLRFNPAEAKVRKRRIEAIVQTGGSTFRTERVATFRAPRFHRLKGPRVRVKRRGKRLVVRWSKIPGAGGYKAAIDIGDGETTNYSVGAGERRLKVRGLGPLSDAQVEVRALSSAGWIGKPGRAKLREPRAIKAPKRLRASRLLRSGGFAVRCTAFGQGRCEATVTKGKKLIARGARKLAYGESKRLRVKLTRAGKRRLRGSRLRTLRLEVAVPGFERVKSKIKLR